MRTFCFIVSPVTHPATRPATMPTKAAVRPVRAAVVPLVDGTDPCTRGHGRQHHSQGCRS